jgi:hypothetical protein
MLRRILAVALAAFAMLFLSACGSRAAGYGVVLWGAASGGPTTGDVVAIVRDTPINDSVLVSLPGEKTPREFLLGRLRAFRSRSDALAFQRAFATNKETWAINTKTDDPPLPVRDSPAQDAKVVYKLASKQLVKIISRSEAQVTVSPYTDWWFEVVTEDGYSGWCFGHFLKEFTVAGDPSAEADRLRAQDDMLAQVMNTTWRPDWFVTMADKGALDLTMFREDVGLFPDPASNTIRLVLPLQSFEFHYSGSPQKQGTASYLFPGTDLRIDVLDRDGGRINVTWKQKEQLVTRLYVTMDADVAGLITAEQKRRADIYAGLITRGHTFTSSAYGTIRLGDDMRFSWQGFGKLVPSLVGPNAKGGGTIDLTLRVAPGIAADYDGALTFLFDEYPGAGVSFLYKAAAGGLRLTSLEDDSIKDLFVERPGLSPVVMFFTQSP